MIKLDEESVSKIIKIAMSNNQNSRARLWGGRTLFETFMFI